MSKITHRELILRHLLDFGSITSWEAIREYGNTRISATIHNLRHRDGYPISSRMVPFRNRYGHVSQYAEYVLEEDGKAPICPQLTLEEFARPVPYKPLAEDYVQTLPQPVAMADNRVSAS
jgi:hypothetical protein